jgi:hypothetical protein
MIGSRVKNSVREVSKMNFEFPEPLSLLAKLGGRVTSRNNWCSER